jgi:hypothetical protein
MLIMSMVSASLPEARYDDMSESSSVPPLFTPYGLSIEYQANPIAVQPAQPRYDPYDTFNIYQCINANHGMIDLHGNSRQLVVVHNTT